MKNICSKKIKFAVLIEKNMVLSMTGFGRAEAIFENKKISIDIRSLNSKNFDLNIRIPLLYKEKEFEIRKHLNEKIFRGKVDCYISIEMIGSSSDVKINKDLIRSYIEELSTIADDGPHFEYLKMAIRLPDAISNKAEEMTEEEFLFFKNLMNEAVEKFQNFRKTEGEILKEELKKNIKNISTYLSKIEHYEEERLSNIKEKYRKTLSEFENIDETRFYQEMAYYTEKLDVSEEKVRLAQHLNYYEEVLENENLNGKKLGFIAQEIGREINTLGSKSNHAEMQKLVVMMKDDLEKIKEQTLNVL